MKCRGETVRLKSGMTQSDPEGRILGFMGAVNELGQSGYLVERKDGSRRFFPADACEE